MSDLKKLKEQAKNLPQRSGIYQFKDEHHKILYVGKALSIKNRVLSYFQKDISLKTQNLLKNSKTIKFIETESEFQALLLEAKLIKIYVPKYNIILKDDKSYLYIFVSLGEEYPKVFAVRKAKIFQINSKKWESFEDFKGEYYGPFPSAKTTYQLLKWLRHIIPFCQQKNLGKKACFYKHLGLCFPCPSEIIHLEENKKIELKRIYRKNIFRLKNLLEGNFDQVKKDLVREMKDLSKNNLFEQASLIRDRINYLDYLLKNNQIEKYLENTNFYIDNQQNSLSKLQILLKQNNLNIDKLNKIEGYDVSNITGKNAVSASVTFINGMPEKKYYRRYKIKIDGKPNDVGMLKETITRRLKHEEWSYPDLILVDGGKPQVKTIFDLLQEKQINIPVIGLAKQQEIMVIYDKNKFLEIKIKRNNSGLQLLQHIRDETHRFAIKYHRFLRSKNFDESK